MKNMKTERNRKRSPRKNAGFYIALAICVVAIAAAAWTTYGSVLQYAEPDNENSKNENSANIATNKDVSGEKYNSSKPAENSKEEKSSTSSYDKSSSQQTSQAQNAVKQTAVDTSKTSPIEKGEIIKIFSPKNPIKSKTTSDWRTHTGIDIRASKGTPVRAITSGTVKFVSKDPLLGNVICINHVGGYIAYYCGVSDTSVVKEGNSVKTGDTIGYVAVVPSEMLDESHLHLEIKLENEYIDPSTYY